MTHADTSNGGPGEPSRCRDSTLSMAAAAVRPGQTEKQWWGKKINDGLMAGDMTEPDGGIHLVGDRTCVM